MFATSSYHIFTTFNLEAGCNFLLRIGYLGRFQSFSLLEGMRLRCHEIELLWVLLTERRTARYAIP